MATKKKNKERQIGKFSEPKKKGLIDPRYKNLVSTIIILIVMLIFFIVNNTRTEPESGPYPPFYQKSENNSPR